MFDNIGKDLDEEAGRRQAISLFATFSGLGTWVGLAVLAGTWAVKEIVAPTPDAELVTLVEEEMAPDLPPPPPPPPPAAAVPDNPDEEQTDEPDELVDEVQELKDQVDEGIKSDVKPAGVVGGVEGGVVGGVVGGVLGGTGGVKVFHNSELVIKKKVTPEYPEAAKSLNLGDQRCLVTVRIDEEGVPYEASVDGCPKVFHDAAREGILKWRWYPAKDGKNRVKAQTTIAVMYKLT